MKNNSSSIQLSCADFTFPLLSHDRSLDLIRDLGFAGVDIGLFEGRSHIQPSTALGKPKESAENVRRLCTDRNLKLADLFLQPGTDPTILAANHHDAGQRKQSREIFERTLEFACECEAEHLSILPGNPWEGEEQAESFDRAVGELSWRAELAQKAGLPLSCEAHFGSIAASPQDALALFSAVPDLGLVLDYAHFVVPGYPVEEIESLIPHAVHVHARGACKDRIQVVTAENTIDFSRMVRSLVKQGYQNWICVEYVWMQKWECDRVDNLSETILMRKRLLHALENIAVEGKIQ